jgi:PAS domain S-box-containing protein
MGLNMIRKEQFSQGFPSSLARWQSVLWISVFVLVYFLAARVSLSFQFKPEGIAAIWPPSGIFLSAILLTRRNIRPYLVSALFLVDLLSEVLAGIPPVVSVVYSFALTGEALLGAWLLRRFLGEIPTFREARHIVGFLLLCILFSTALMTVVATLASTIFLKTSFGSSWLWWWSSDAVGSVLVTPLIMSLAFSIKTKFSEFKKWQFIESAALLFLAGFLSNYIFSHFLGNSWFILLLNIFIFPFLIWAAIRFGILGATAVSTILAVIILLYAIAGSLAYLGLASNLEAIILVQVYIAMATIPSLFLAVVITERKQVEMELRESEDKFKYVFDNSVIGKSITLPSGKIHVNKAFCEMLGYSLNELQSKRWQDITHPDDIELTQREIDSLLLGTKEDARFIKRYFRKNRSVVWADVSTSLRMNHGGEPLYFMTSAVDISENRRAEEALRLSEERYRRIFENAQIGIYRTTPNGKILDANPALIAMLGYSNFKDLSQRNLEKKVFAPKYPRNNFKEMIEKNDSIRNLEAEWTRKDGSLVYVTENTKAVHGANGKVLYYEGTVEDITERKKAEQKLARSTQELQVRNADLERFNKVAIGRELRMIELKKQINELHKQLGQKPSNSLSPMDESTHHRRKKKGSLK